MKKQILAVIEQIEKEYDVKILYACESGSRAWGFPSKDSDYDVRFIYIHKQNWYLTIDQRRDVIEIPKQDSLSIPINELFDISGWELTKALRLFRKSNPALLEWLHANIVYLLGREDPFLKECEGRSPMSREGMNSPSEGEGFCWTANVYSGMLELNKGGA